MFIICQFCDMFFELLGSSAKFAHWSIDICTFSQVESLLVKAIQYQFIGCQFWYVLVNYLGEFTQ